MITWSIILWLLGGLINFIMNIPTILIYIKDVALVSWCVLKFVGFAMYVLGGAAGIVISIVHNKVWRI